MNRIGKIILVNNYANPHVIIVDKPDCVRALELVKSCNEMRSLQLNEDDVVKIKYRGKKLDNRKVDLSRVSGIYSLHLREIGALTDEAYFKLLRNFNNYQVAQGANSLGFLEVKQDIQDQIIEKSKVLFK